MGSHCLQCLGFELFQWFIRHLTDLEDNSASNLNRFTNVIKTRPCSLRCSASRMLYFRGRRRCHAAFGRNRSLATWTYCVPHVAAGYLWLKLITYDKLVSFPQISFDCAAARTSNSIRSVREN